MPLSQVNRLIPHSSPGDRISGIAVVCCDSVLYEDVICPDNL